MSRSHFAGNDFVDVAPDPFFSGLDRPHHGVAGVMKMFCGVFVLRRIAASDIPADHAHPQVNPRVAKFDALFTDVGIGSPELDLIEVLTFLSHLIPLVIIRRVILSGGCASRKRSATAVEGPLALHQHRRPGKAFLQLR
jgi:hypothetical protein